jgi:prepilin-type N-terminal cleavage/methylation domain-containing protein
MSEAAPAREAGFTLIEVVLASALFAFVALTGFEVVRALSASTALIAQRARAAAQLRVAAGELRSAALSASAVWKPRSACGDAVEFLQRDAGGTSFTLYFARAAALVRAAAARPMNPCDHALAAQTVVGSIARLIVKRFAASALPAHTDPVSGAPDGGILVPAGVSAVSVDAHVTDIDGSQVRTGNDVVEVTLDAEPVRTTVDLLAGNRPSGYTQTLAYACDGRCEANGPFPEIRAGAFDDCAVTIDFAQSPASYVPAAYGFAPTAGGGARIVVTAYAVAGGYAFAFGGPAPLTLERAWPPAVWPPAGSPLAGRIADAYPVDYADNAVFARGSAQLAADLGEPAAFAAALQACADMHADPTFGG